MPERVPDTGLCHPCPDMKQNTTILASKVTDWTNTIVDNCLKELQSLNKPYKYIITCIIMQKNGAGVNTCASMTWDTTKDNLCQASASLGHPLATSALRLDPAAPVVASADRRGTEAIRQGGMIRSTSHRDYQHLGGDCSIGTAPGASLTVERTNYPASMDVLLQEVAGDEGSGYQVPHRPAGTFPRVMIVTGKGFAIPPPSRALSTAGTVINGMCPRGRSHRPL